MKKLAFHRDNLARCLGTRRGRKFCCGETPMRNHRVRAAKAKEIPPPPGPEAGYDEIIAYFSKYTLDELERAGYTEEVPPEEIEELAASAAYYLLCEHGLHLKLSRKDYELLSRLSARQDIAVDALVKRWVVARLRQEAKQLTTGRKRSPAVKKQSR